MGLLRHFFVVLFSKRLDFENFLPNFRVLFEAQSFAWLQGSCSQIFLAGKSPWERTRCSEESKVF
jgi:hypothetical protein